MKRSLYNITKGGIMGAFVSVMTLIILAVFYIWWKITAALAGEISHNSRGKRRRGRINVYNYR